MATNKFMTSISTIPNQSKYFTDNNLYSRSFSDYHNPFKSVLPLKFPQKKIRRQNQVNMLTETKQNPEKSHIKNFPQANNSARIFGSPEKQKRYFKSGVFSNLQRQSIVTLPINRSLEDIGAKGNRKKINQFISNKPDPIITGQKEFRHNSSLEKVWIEPRRHRDNGVKCQETLHWNAKKSKTYMELYRSGNNKKKEKKCVKI